MPAYDPSVAGPLWRTLQRLLWRTPLLVPLVVTCGVICGGVGGWVAAVVALSVAVNYGMRRVAACAVLCGAVVAISQAVRQSHAEALHEALAQRGAVELHGVVVQQLLRGCVVQTGWTGLRVAVRGDELDWSVGAEVRFVAAEQPVVSSPVEGMYSAERWMRGQGVCAQLAYLHGEQVGLSHGWYRMIRMAEAVRASLAGRLMPPGTQGDARHQTLCALVLGEKALAEDATMERFRRGGCLHAFAVSGLHVGLVAGLLWAMLRAGRVRPSIGRWVLLAGVGLYVTATGLAVPALRAYLMLVVVLFALILKRHSTLFNTWCFVALLILVYQPFQLYQAGFQLSFAIYAAICLGIQYGVSRRRWFGPDDYLPPRIYTRVERFAARADLALRGVVVASLCAWLASLPFSALHFHTINTVSYITNIAITPVLPCVMLCGLLALFLGAVPLVGPACLWLACQSAGVLLWLVGAVGSTPAALLPAHEPAPPSAAIIGAMQYGKSFAVLGNPGVLLGDVQHAGSAHFTIEPAVFHSGFSPVAIAAASENTVSLYSHRWPHLRALPRDLSTPYSFSTSAGHYTIYSPPGQGAAQAQPLVVWEQPGGLRVIYAAQAAASTLECLPEPERRADVLILGYSPQEPVMDTDLLSSFGAGELLLLPSTSYFSAEPPQLPATKVRQLSPGEIYQLSR